MHNIKNEEKPVDEGKTLSESFTCTACSEKFLSKLELNRHLEVPCTICLKCNSKFMSQEELQKHYLTQHVDESFILTYTCNICRKQGYCERSMQLHFKEKHLGQTKQSDDEFECYYGGEEPCKI